MSASLKVSATSEFPAPMGSPTSCNPEPPLLASPSPSPSAAIFTSAGGWTSSCAFLWPACVHVWKQAFQGKYITNSFHSAHGSSYQALGFIITRRKKTRKCKTNTYIFMISASLRLCFMVVASVETCACMCLYSSASTLIPQWLLVWFWGWFALVDRIIVHVWSAVQHAGIRTHLWFSAALKTQQAFFFFPSLFTTGKQNDGVHWQLNTEKQNNYNWLIMFSEPNTPFNTVIWTLQK